MRACAAVGVVVTHVAFQTGHTGGITGRLFGRFDLAVAVFFALSGFLLWRGHAAAARGLRPAPPTAHYLRSRLVRIMPAYLLAVVVILALLPEAKADFTVWLANLTLTQIYVPLTLTAGILLLVRGGHGAGRVDRQPGRLDAPAVAAPGRHGRDRAGRVCAGRLTAGRLREPAARDCRPGHGQDGDGRGGGRGAACPA